MDRLSDYDYVLPEELIAQTPLQDRSASRLMWLRLDGGIEHRSFVDVVEILKPGDLLVMNDTRVSAIRLYGKKMTGAAVEALLLRETAPACYEALVKPAKRLRIGAAISFADGLAASVVGELEDGIKVLEFKPVENFRERLAKVGLTPLPPYIHEILQDKERYQTVYGTVGGSAAAPTAGLHFTPELLGRLDERGIETAKVTLHVGIDTFRPVQVEDLDQHRMHGETCSVTDATVEMVRKCSGRVIAVGTTTVRTLESFADGPRQLRTGSMDSRLFIRPGFRFQIIDGMFTNFHLPRTTMLTMISALARRERILDAYREAVAANYRFLSFGDSMLIL